MTIDDSFAARRRAREENTPEAIEAKLNSDPELVERLLWARIAEISRTIYDSPTLPREMFVEALELMHLLNEAKGLGTNWGRAVSYALDDRSRYHDNRHAELLAARRKTLPELYRRLSERGLVEKVS